MQVPLLSMFLLLLLPGLHQPATAQTTLTTQALSQTAVCPGTLLDVPFLTTGPFGSGNSFSVQFTKGTESLTAVATTVIGNPATGQYTASVKLPGPLAAGMYQVRVVSSNPVATGSVSPTLLLVKTQPATAPSLAAQSIGDNTSQYTFCQNDSPLTLSNLVGPAPDNYRILYDQGAALAPTSQRTFVPPTITTTTTGRTTYNFRYVVIDESKGCSPVEQPGTVSYLIAEVKTRPAAPALPAASLTYCQNQTASPLLATITTTGADLFWYDAAGNRLTDSAPRPSTSLPGTATYLVGQSLNFCEGPKTSVSVTVRAASPAPTAPQTRIELCRGATAPPLVATGTNLIWTDPTGVTSTTAPSPATLNASKTMDGDIYTVTQTGPNGCPSAPLPIRVVVQAQPTLSLSGGANVNLGADVSLRLTFTGMGPYRYRITTSPVTGPGSTTLTGTATKDTTLLLLAERSTVYQVAEVGNGCGVGLPGSPATATTIVLVPTIRTSPLPSATACAGSAITANFQTTGTFNASNVFRLQISRTNADTTKLSYTDLTIVQQVGNTQLTGTLPATATAGTYLVRVVATNPKIPIIGIPSTTTLTVLEQASATLTTSTSAIVAGDVAKLALSFTSSGPWTFSYRDSTDVLAATQTVTTSANPYTLEVKPGRTTAYRLVSVSNGCGLNTRVSGRAVVSVSPLLAVEPLAGLVTVFPVPSINTVTVQIDPSLLTETTILTLVDEKGQPVLTKATQQQHTQLGLSEQPAGVYLLQIQVNGQKTTRRILKQ